MDDTVVIAESVSKKFCRSLKRSLWYGVRDLSSELVGGTNGLRDLRRHEFWAIRDVSFELKRGETLGLIGPNGAGKTTLLRMLNGLIKPDRGKIEVHGRMQALIALGAGFNPILTGRENIYVNAAVLGLEKTEVDKRLTEIIEFSGLNGFMDTPVQNYSSGMQVRLGFAVAAHMEPDILLVDEVLAVGDEGFQTKCLNKIGNLRGNGTAIILVSHNMHTISTFANRVILIKDGKHHIFPTAADGIAEYRKLFQSKDNSGIQTISSGNNIIQFYKVEVGTREFSPGESFEITMHYESSRDLNDCEVDIVIYSSSDTGQYFQATNRTYKKDIHLHRGKYQIRIVIERIPLQNAIGRVAITIWSKDRTSLLFWWRIPVKFKGVAGANGSNFLKVSFYD